MARAATGEGHPYETERRYLARDGSTVEVVLRAELLLDADGRPSSLVSLLRDVTEQRRAEAELRASRERLRSIVDNTPAAVSVVGADDRLSLVNGAYEERHGLAPGTAVGLREDELLPAAAAASARAIRARVAASGVPDEREEVVRREGDEHVYLTVTFPLPGEGPAAVCIMQTDITDRKRREEGLRERLRWTDEIHAAVSGDRLVLLGQPVVALRTGEVDHVELLLRLRADDGSDELIPPSAFLPAAEHHGLIGIIDRWVVAHALEIARDRRVAINLSGLTISDPEQVGAIERLIRDSGTPPEQLVFEITETAAVEHIEHARRFAERLRRLGCSVALDDFGVGYGSFTYLRHLPVDHLKIDREFVRDVVAQAADRRVVSTMVDLARSFGMSTVAEGVEDPAALAVLSGLGVDFAQGYLLGRPAPLPARAPTPVAALDRSVAA